MNQLQNNEIKIFCCISAIANMHKADRNCFAVLKKLKSLIMFIL